MFCAAGEEPVVLCEFYLRFICIIDKVGGLLQPLFNTLSLPEEPELRSRILGCDFIKSQVQLRDFTDVIARCKHGLESDIVSLIFLNLVPGDVFDLPVHQLSNRPAPESSCGSPCRRR